MVIRCLVVPQPPALALAAWMRELAASTRPLVSLESKASRTPSQCVRRLLAVRLMGSRRQRRARLYQRSSSGSAVSRLSALQMD